MKNEDIKQCLGLSPQCAEMILQMDMLAETKLLLIAMFQRGISKAKFQDLVEQLNCHTLDLEMARLQLTTHKIAKQNARFDVIEFNDKWTELVEEQKNASLQARIDSASSSDKSNGTTGETETSVSRISPESRSS